VSDHVFSSHPAGEHPDLVQDLDEDVRKPLAVFRRADPGGRRLLSGD
jgi:hypothetical protein